MFKDRGQPRHQLIPAARSCQRHRKARRMIQRWRNGVLRLIFKHGSHRRTTVRPCASGVSSCTLRTWKTLWKRTLKLGWSRPKSVTRHWNARQNLLTLFHFAGLVKLWREIFVTFDHHKFVHQQMYRPGTRHCFYNLLSNSLYIFEWFLIRKFVPKCWIEAVSWFPTPKLSSISSFWSLVWY